MRIEWDPAKAASNRRKHGVHFAEAVVALEDEHALTIQDDASGERRFVTIGMDSTGRLLVVVYTVRPDRLRVISARGATKSEARQYAEAREP